MPTLHTLFPIAIVGSYAFMSGYLAIPNPKLMYGYYLLQSSLANICGSFERTKWMVWFSGVVVVLFFFSSNSNSFYICMWYVFYSVLVHIMWLASFFPPFFWGCNQRQEEKKTRENTHNQIGFSVCTTKSTKCKSHATPIVHQPKSN